MARKEPVDIGCPGCSAQFRVWMPAGLISEWSEGEEIGCIKCAERFLIRRGKEGLLEAKSLSGKEEEAAEKKVTEEEALEKVLLVDDDKLALAIIESTFTDINVKLVTAKSAEEALKKLEKDGFALVVTDLHLKNPDDPATRLDGEDLLKKIKESGKNIPAIIMTGKDIVDDLVPDPKWFTLHVKGFIQKGNPFWSEELKQKIREVLELV